MIQATEDLAPQMQALGCENVRNWAGTLGSP